MTATLQAPARVAISCVICTFNEGRRLSDVLRSVVDHPALFEVIVVDDGSTDGTAALVERHPQVRVIRYEENRGKTYAMSCGVAAARGDYIMFLDADLRGLTALEVHQLASPVLAQRADAVISLRNNSLAIYRAIGLDFVSGERIVPAALLKAQIDRMQALPRWGAEAFINDLIIEGGLAIEIVDWPTVSNVRKHEKLGLLRGAAAEMRMVADALAVLSPVAILRQNLSLLRLRVPGRVKRGRGLGVRWPLPLAKQLGALRQPIKH